MLNLIPFYKAWKVNKIFLYPRLYAYISLYETRVGKFSVKIKIQFIQKIQILVYYSSSTKKMLPDNFENFNFIRNQFINEF